MGPGGTRHSVRGSCCPSRWVPAPPHRSRGGQIAGGALAQQFWAVAGGLAWGVWALGVGGVAWGSHCQPPGTLQGLSEPPAMQCWGLPWLWRLSRRCSPHSRGLAVLMPRTCNTPRVGEQSGGSSRRCPGCPQPCTAAARGLGPPSLSCCIPLLVFLRPRGLWLGGVPVPILLCVVLLSSPFFLSVAGGCVTLSCAPHGAGGGGQ